MKKNLGEKELDAVTGGDYGDKSKERSSTPEGVAFMYEVGQSVEVYRRFEHAATKTGLITDRRVGTFRADCETYYAGEYYITFNSWTMADDWYSADDIESN